MNERINCNEILALLNSEDISILKGMLKSLRGNYNRLINYLNYFIQEKNLEVTPQVLTAVVYNKISELNEEYLIVGEGDELSIDDVIELYKINTME